jgi:hypothetical protein
MQFMVFLSCIHISSLADGRMCLIYFVPHLPYSPDFLLFPKLKTSLKGRRFQTIEEIQENAITELRAIPEIAFQEAFQQLKKH